MKKYDSYAASYPLAYYELGTIYSFYGQASSTGTPATADQIRKYSSVLQELETEDSTFIGNYGAKLSTGHTNGAIERYYAVVVDKVNAGKDSYIVVMLCNKNDGRTEYYTRDYAVNSSCFTDSKNLMQPSTHLSFSSHQKTTSNAIATPKVGGITKAESSKKVGGITRADNNVKETSSSVGGITIANKKKVGGITRA